MLNEEKEKVQDDSKITKIYDKAKTPYERLLECNEITKKKKKEIKGICEVLNPAELMREIEKLQDKLIKLCWFSGKWTNELIENSY